MGATVRGEQGEALNAEFSVGEDGEGTYLILESRSGSPTSAANRNPDYAPALRVLLGRLSVLGATLEQVRVESQRILHLAPEARVIPLPSFTPPIALSRLVAGKIELLRNEICNNQRNIGAAPSAQPRRDSGAWRRIRLNLSIPDAASWDPSEIEAHLGAGEDLREVMQIVEDEEEAIQLKNTDALVQARRRLEQGPLRRVLGLVEGQKVQACDLCGRPYDAWFLIAAHIKPRAQCSHEERLDYRNIAMRACVFGCDKLYDGGFIVVDEGGIVRARPGVPERTGLAEELKRCQDRPCHAFNDRTAPYFAWHREHVLPPTQR